MSSSSSPSVRMYTQGSGTASSSQFPSSPVIQTRNPTSSDIKGPFGNYPIGQVWINQTGSTAYMLTALSSSGAVVSATWVLLSSGSGILNTLTGNSGGAVSPSAGNINLVGSGQISIAGNPGTNTLTVSSSAFEAFQWMAVSGTTQAMATNTGYVTQNSALTTLTLPTTSAFGDRIAVMGNGSGGWQLAQNSGQIIHFGNQDTTTGTSGFLASTNQYDVVTMICTVANTEFTVWNSVGNIGWK